MRLLLLLLLLQQPAVSSSLAAPWLALCAARGPCRRCSRCSSAGKGWQAAALCDGNGAAPRRRRRARSTGSGRQGLRRCAAAATLLRCWARETARSGATSAGGCAVQPLRCSAVELGGRGGCGCVPWRRGLSARRRALAPACALRAPPGVPARVRGERGGSRVCTRRRARRVGGGNRARRHDTNTSRARAAVDKRRRWRWRRTRRNARRGWARSLGAPAQAWCAGR